MRKNVLKKSLTVSIACLFFCLSMSTVFSHDITANACGNEGAVKVEISEFSYMGRAQKYTHVISLEDEQKLLEEFFDAKTPEEKFLVLKDHGLIRDNTTWDDLKQEFDNADKCLNGNWLNRGRGLNGVSWPLVNHDCDVVGLGVGFTLGWPLWRIIIPVVIIGIVMLPVFFGFISTYNGTDGNWSVFGGLTLVVVSGFVGLWLAFPSFCLIIGHASQVKAGCFYNLTG